MGTPVIGREHGGMCWAGVDPPTQMDWRNIARSGTQQSSAKQGTPGPSKTKPRGRRKEKAAEGWSGNIWTHVVILTFGRLSEIIPPVCVHWHLHDRSDVVLGLLGGGLGALHLWCLHTGRHLRHGLMPLLDCTTTDACQLCKTPLAECITQGVDNERSRATRH